MKGREKYIAVIPAYNAGQAVREVIEKTLQLVDQVIVIDDGSGEEHKQLFESYKNDWRVTVVNHEVNLGKGYALMSGFREALKQEFDYLFTIDADGQHRPEEIERFKEELADRLRNFDLVVGEREMGTKTPWRSRMGNKLTAKMVSLVYGVSAHDTQSGFRVMRRELVEWAVNEVRPGRYETEMEILTGAWREGRKVGFVPVSTIYFNNNRNSKFRPIIDSLRVWGQFFKFAAVSISAWLFDYSVFVILNAFSPIHFTAVNVFSKGLSMAYYFTVNKYIVFRSQGRLTGEVLRYLGLAAVNIVVATGLLWVVVLIGITEYLAKPLADVAMFGINFWVMKLVVYRQFRKKDRNK